MTKEQLESEAWKFRQAIEKARDKLYTDMDIALSNDMLTKYIHNLDWDIGFMMALLGIEFCELKYTSFSIKKKLLGEIRKLVDEYKELPDEERKLNRYERI